MGRLKGCGLPSRLGCGGSRLVTTQRAVMGEDHARRSNSWYDTKEWRNLRMLVLRRDKFTCQETGVPLSGKYPAPNSPVVDHIEPHRGDRTLFFDPKNCRAVTKEWHDKHKQSMEKSGRAYPRG